MLLSVGFSTYDHRQTLKHVYSASNGRIDVDFYEILIFLTSRTCFFEGFTPFIQKVRVLVGFRAYEYRHCHNHVHSASNGVLGVDFYDFLIFLTSRTCFFEVFLPELELDLKTC